MEHGIGGYAKEGVKEMTKRSDKQKDYEKRNTGKGRKGKNTRSKKENMNNWRKITSKRRFGGEGGSKYEKNKITLTSREG